jgi:NAD(P)-dependent dehydrogenase (short-subunit alcohol dehydrogenase family)
MSASTNADDRVAIVTGAASGIGAGIARTLREAGWLVAGLDRRRSENVDFAAEVDMADAAGVDAAVAAAADRLGAPRAAVSAAGHYAMLPVSEISVEQWTTMLRVHLGGLLNLARAVRPRMPDSGDRCLVAVGSELAIGGGDEDVHYAAAKGAVLGLARSLAAEWAADGVRVNVVAPGPTDTPLLAADSPWRAPDYLATLPTRALATPTDIALTARFLIEEATFCTGEVISPNSGAVI